MKIRTKITLMFILLIALLQLLTFVFIYYFAKSYNENEFYLRLKQRATIAAQTYLGEDKMSKDIYEEVRTKHLQVLPHEQEHIYNVDAETNTIYSDLRGQVPISFIERIFEQEYATLKIEPIFYTGLLYHDNEGDFIVVLSAEDQYGTQKLDNIRYGLVLAFLISLILTSLFGQYYAKRALSPITEIIERVDLIRATNLHLRLDKRPNRDELAKLTETFNNMLDRLEASFDLQNNFINNASHELRNPLTAILGQIEVGLKKERSSENYIAILSSIEKEAFRLNKLVNGLLKLAQADNQSAGLIREKVRIDEMILEVKEAIDKTIPDNRIQLEFSNMPEDESHLEVFGNYSLLSASLSNILDNACKFSGNDVVDLRLIVNGEGVRIIITDRGIGIPHHEMKHIFEPFFRGANVRLINGYGFGLPMAFRIIKMHKGDIRVTSQENTGTIVTLFLPSVAAIS